MNLTFCEGFGDIFQVDDFESKLNKIALNFPDDEQISNIKYLVHCLIYFSSLQ